MNIGKAIRAIRKEAGYSQKELSDLMGFTQTALSQIETGVKKPNAGTTERLCKVLNIAPIILHLKAFEPSDVPVDKQQKYELIYPAIDGLLSQLIDKKK